MYELKGKGFPLGSLACQWAAAFLLESRLRDKPSIRPQFTLHEPEGEERSRMINVPLVWSDSFTTTHTHTHTGPRGACSRTQKKEWTFKWKATCA